MTLKIESWDINDVHPYEKNVKIHDDKQVKKIANSIKQFGFDQPLVVDADGVLIKGHGRRLAAIELGLTHVPVVVRTDLTPDQVKASRLADNRVAMGDIDTFMLQEELRDIDMELDGIFDAKELAFLNADLLAINPEGISENIIEAMENQTLEAIQNFKDIEEETVRVADVLGFKTFKVDQQRELVRFMANIREKYQAEGAEALHALATEFNETYKEA